MKGWLIYEEQGAVRNRWFIRRLIDEAKSYGADLQLRLVHELDGAPLPDFAIVRAMDASVNDKLEKRGVRTVNNAQTAKIANDKWETYLLCKRLNLPVLETVRAETPPKTFPQIFKSRGGHGGAEVFWTHTLAEAQAKAEEGKRYVFQTPNRIVGKDMRVYAIGGKIVGAVLRQSERDFRSNFSLGGNVVFAQADEWQKATVEKLYQELRFDFVGVDFLPTEEGWVLNEIEDSAGTRMLYHCSDIDIVQPFMKWILR